MMSLLQYIANTCMYTIFIFYIFNFKTYLNELLFPTFRKCKCIVSFDINQKKTNSFFHSLGHVFKLKLVYNISFYILVIGTQPCALNTDISICQNRLNNLHNKSHTHANINKASKKDTTSENEKKKTFSSK